MIDLRSDTATRPTSGMRAAIADAAVGDEQRREDPSVNELEARAATLLGQEEAVFLPTATMANQIALRAAHRAGRRAGRGGELPRLHLGARRAGRPLGCRHAWAAGLGRPLHAGAGARGLPRTGNALPAHARCLGREQSQRLGRAHLAAGGDRRAARALRRARSALPPRRRQAAERGGRERGERRHDRLAGSTPSPSASRRGSAARWAPSLPARRRRSGRLGG